MLRYDPGPLAHEGGRVIVSKGWHRDPERIFQQALAGVAWQAREVVLFGRKVTQPRLVAQVGRPYAYSGLALAGAPIPAWALPVLEAASEAAGVAYNAILFNLYRDGRDSIGWHADDEPSLGSAPIVASLSLGATRRFSTRARGGKPSHVDLEAGDFLVMPAGFQATHQHALPKTAAAGPRISLTFRWL